MMKMAMIATIGLVFGMGAQPVFGHGVSLAKASELALHRVERLVVLCNLGDPNLPVNLPGLPGFDPLKCKNDPSKPKKGIDPDYQNKLLGLTTIALAHQSEDDPSFKTTVFQSHAEDGSRRAVEIVLDGDGRPLSYQELAGGVAQNAPEWPDKDATTLMENALHFLLEGAVTSAELKPFSERLKSVGISPGMNAQVEKVAVVDFTAEGESQILRVRMKINGNFDSFEFIR